MKKSKHRFLGSKAALVREATARLSLTPDDEPARQYLRGLCDALHGTDAPIALQAIHVARQVIIATQEA